LESPCCGTTLIVETSIAVVLHLLHEIASQ
jgi:hypothetical protein